MESFSISEISKKVLTVSVPAGWLSDLKSHSDYCTVPGFSAASGATTGLRQNDSSPINRLIADVVSEKLGGDALPARPCHKELTKTPTVPLCVLK